MPRRNRSESTSEEISETDIRQAIIDDIDDLYGYAAFGDMEVIIRKTDGWINVTELCKQAGKYFKNWLANKASKEMIAELAEILEYPVTSLVKEGKYITRGTYAHSSVVSAIAYWISPSFGARMCLWLDEWKLVDDNAKLYYRAISTIKSNPADQPERLIRDQLAATMGGDIEVECETGWIDILTKTHLVEVKRAKLWKHAVGQLVAYGLDYPGHRLMMYLFDADRCDHELIEQKCGALGIEVRFH